jgi:hypothetical protein
MAKIYFVNSELCDEMSFENEVERNEMALALVEEHAEFFAMRCLNWYGEMVSAEEAWEAATNSVYTWENILSFDVPTQVAFWSEEDKRYIGGIGYGTEIICSCCGGIVEISEVYEFAPVDIIPIVEHDGDWIDLTEQILTDDEKLFASEYFGTPGEMIDEW